MKPLALYDLDIMGFGFSVFFGLIESYISLTTVSLAAVRL